VLWVGTLLELFDKTLLEEAFDGAVKRAGAQADFAAGALRNLLQDGIAVAVAVSERYEDVEGVAR
jgi:hypothetical protein